MQLLTRLFLFSLVFISTKSISQEFNKWEDKYLKVKFVKYYDPSAQIIIQKSTSLDSNLSSKYEIGLIIFRTSILTDDFMKIGGQIVFEDMSALNFADKVVTNYLYSGRHELSLKHTLTDSELKSLQTKKISFFRINDYEYKIDRWQKQDIIKAFLKISDE